MEQRLPYSFAKRHQILLQSEDSNQYWLATEALSQSVLDEATRYIRQVLPTKIVAEDDFRQRLSAVYENSTSTAEDLVDGMESNKDLDALANAIPETEDLLEQEDDAPIIQLINAILREAIKLEASDIHIETFEKKLIVRFRVDGILREVLQPKKSLAPMLVSRIKVMAKLDIAEKRVPQDGRISLKIGQREVDIRVSTLPAADGERVVLRLLDKQAGRLNLETLGMEASTRTALQALLARPHGILLVTGPTGSGKTTTLYAGLKEIQTGQKNIMTIEDPIEYNLDGIGQTQVNSKADMTFARGLRAILRQDPDVVMVGEIRDLETAEIAIQASLTGHLVLSTLHTNTAIGAIVRLEDMGIEPFLLSSSLIGSLAQRLVRCLCDDCKAPYELSPAETELLAIKTGEEVSVHRPVGCEACGHQGYQGRTGIYELVVIDDSMRELIHDRAAEARLTELARSRTPSIFESGRNLILQGITSIEEVLRVTQEN